MICENVRVILLLIGVFSTFCSQYSFWRDTNIFFSKSNFPSRETRTRETRFLKQVRKHLGVYRLDSYEILNCLSIREEGCLSPDMLLQFNNLCSKHTFFQHLIIFDYWVNISSAKTRNYWNISGVFIQQVCSDFKFENLIFLLIVT